MLHCVCLLAQTDSIYLKEQTLSQVNVSAPFLKRTIKSASPLKILDQRTLERLGSVTLSDALGKVSGLTVRDYGGEGGMKTVSLRSLGAQHTAVSLDGVPLTNTQSGQIDLSRYSMDNLESLEVDMVTSDNLLSAARLLALSGVVRLLSRRENLEGKSFALKTQLRAGSWGYFSPLVKLTLPLGDGSQTSFYADMMRSDNHYRYYLENGVASGYQKRRNNKVSQTHLEWNLHYQPARGSLDFKAYYYDSYRHLPGPVILYNDVSYQRQKDRNAFFQAAYQTYFDSGLSLKMSAKADYAFQMFRDKGSAYPQGELINRYHQREYYASGALSYQKGVLSLGNALDVAYNNLTTNTGVRPSRLTLLDALTLRLKAGPLEASAQAVASLYRGNETLKNLGKTEYKKLSPALSLSLRPVASLDWYLRASFKDIFRVPSFSELYYDRFGSRSLQPEKTAQLNIGTAFSVSDAAPRSLWQWSMTLDAYWNSVTDKIVAMPYNMFFWTMVNLGKVRIFGLDMSQTLTFRPKDNQSLSLMANYTFQDAVDRTDPTSVYYGDLIPYTPRHSWAITLNWENPFVNVSLGLNAVSRRYSDVKNTTDTYLKGYEDVSLSLYRKFHFWNLEEMARLDVQNLFSCSYQIVKNYPMPSRGFKVTVSVNI